MVMRKIQVVMISVLLSGISQYGFAQEAGKNSEKEKIERNENLNREMTLEREYDPIVQDAAKVNTLPDVREIKISKRPIVYSDFTTPMIPQKGMTVLPAGSLMTDVEHIKRNGYLHLAGGMLMNFAGDFGYHILDTDRDFLSAYFSHRSMNGNVDFENYGLPKRKAKFNDNIGGLDFKHYFDKAILKLGGNFGYSAFNYFGMPINAPLALYNVQSDSATNQGNRLINVYGGVASTVSSSLGYHFDVDYSNFNQKYSLHKDNKGMTENHIGIGLGLNSPDNDGKHFGADIKVNILSYTKPLIPEKFSDMISDSAFNTHFNGTLTPFFKMEDDKLKLKLGANFMFVSQNDEINVYASPNINLDVPIGIWSVFYANLGGGIESNSMAELSRTNRYINPMYTADASKTWADLQLGIRSSASAGLWFDIFAGYKYTESDILFNPSSFSWIENGFNNVSVAFQPTTQRIQAGATLKYDYKKVFDFYIKGVYDYYILKYSDTWKNVNIVAEPLEDKDMEAYGKPTFVANAGVNVRPVNPLTLSLDYSMISGIYAYLPGNNSNVASNVKMKTINDLRFRASWKFNDMIGVYVQCNNLLFQKYEMYYGYPMQPFSAMAGFVVNF